MTRGGARSPSQRQLRVGEELRHALAWVLERGEIRDPRLDGSSVTVTEVRVSPDLRQATVFIIPLGGISSEQAVSVLSAARAFLRRRIGQTVKLRYVPDLIFRADHSFDQADRISTLLRDPAVARDVAKNSDEEGDDRDP